MSEDSLLERVTTAAEERHLSQNTLTAYRRTWLKLIAWSAAEELALEPLPSDRAGEFYEEATRGVKLKEFEKREQLEDYLQWSAVALANAHCRANPRFASEALRAFRDFKQVKDTIRDIGRNYIAQVAEDYDAFREK